MSIVSPFRKYNTDGQSKTYLCLSVLLGNLILTENQAGRLCKYPYFTDKKIEAKRHKLLIILTIRKNHKKLNSVLSF